MSLATPAPFFAVIRRDLFGGALVQAQVDGVNALLTVGEGWPTSWMAYGLATAFHETERAMRPVTEYGEGRGHPYGVPGPNGGQVPYGRGYVQLTWDKNYEAMDRDLGLNGALVGDYDLALKPDIAGRIMRYGMDHGSFTGVGLANYLPRTGDASSQQFVSARRVINGQDCAIEIAGYASSFQTALTVGNWS